MAMETKDGGIIDCKQSKSGVKYSIYIPPDVNENTPIYTYAYGGGGEKDWWSHYHESGNYGVYDALLENGSDSIVIMPSMDWGADWGTNTMEIINSVRDEYNITNLNVTGSGFSKGGDKGAYIVAENIRQNPGIDPQVVFCIDEYKDIQYMPQRIFNDDRKALFKENGTVFFTFDPTWKGKEVYEKYTAEGLKFIRVNCTNEHGSTQGHIQINENFLKSGAYDYLAGGMLPKDGYEYQICNYNEETGQYEWETIDYDKICTVDKLYDFFDMTPANSSGSILSAQELMSLDDLTLKSDDKVLETHLNNIRSAIRSTDLLKSYSGGATDLNMLPAIVSKTMTFESTTKMPSRVPEVVNSYMSTCTSLLSKLAQETSAFANIGESIGEMDFYLSRKAQEIEEFDFDEYDPDTDDSSSASDDQTQNPSEENNPPQDSSNENNNSNSNNNDSSSSSGNSNSSPSSGGTNGGSNSGGGPSGGGNSGGDGGSSESGNTSTPVAPSDALNDFPAYQDVQTSTNQLVFEHEYGYKLIVHNENGVINGVEHYYDLGSSTKALEMLEQIKSAYKNNTYIKDIICEGQYVKVIFNNDIYKGYDLSSVQKLYTNLPDYKQI